MMFSDDYTKHYSTSDPGSGCLGGQLVANGVMATFFWIYSRPGVAYPADGAQCWLSQTGEDTYLVANNKVNASYTQYTGADVESWLEWGFILSVIALVALIVQSIGKAAEIDGLKKFAGSVVCL